MNNTDIHAKLQFIYAEIHSLLEDTKGQRFSLDESPDLASDLAFLKYITEEAGDLMNTNLFDQYLEDFAAD